MRFFEFANNKPAATKSSVSVCQEGQQFEAARASRSATAISNAVDTITSMGSGDSGYSWLDDWQSPIGDVWREYFSVDRNVLFAAFLDEKLSPDVLNKWAQNKDQWVDLASVDLNDSDSDSAGNEDDPDEYYYDGDDKDWVKCSKCGGKGEDDTGELCQDCGGGGVTYVGAKA